MKQKKFGAIVTLIIGLGIGFVLGFVLMRTQAPKKDTDRGNTQNQRAEAFLEGETNSEEKVLQKDDQLTEESKEPQKQNTENYKRDDVEYVSVSTLAASTKAKYDENNKQYVYKEPINGIHRTDDIQIKFDYDVMEKVQEDYWQDVICIYCDPNFQHAFGTTYSWDEESKTVHINPSGTPANRVWIANLDTGIVRKYPYSENCLFDIGVNEWGNIKTLYLVCYYDVKTAEKLETPEVHVINLEGELKETPKTNYVITQDGRLKLTWTPVTGAELYVVCRAEMKDGKYVGGLNPIATTEQCVWTTSCPVTSDLSVNKEFKYFEFGEEDWNDSLKAESRIEKYKEEYPEEVEKKTAIKGKKAGEESFLCVIAISKEGTSMPGNMISYELLSSNLPYCIATNTLKANELPVMSRYHTFDSVEEFPVCMYIEMCDGRVMKKVIDYATAEATVVKEHAYEIDEEGKRVRKEEDVERLQIPYSVEGTGFIGTVLVTNYDGNQLQRDLKNIEEREEQMRLKGGSITPENSVVTNPLTDDNADQVAVVKDTVVFANSALSEYLAIQMMAGTLVINLTDFPEAASDEILMDALMEAYYQNPMIFGISQYATVANNKYLYLYYNYETDEKDKMQQELSKKVKEIVKEIITDDMTDTQKEMAINEYLCNHLTYNEAALADARENDFLQVSSQNFNSFNAYGALMEEKCVCRGYADAFNLLAKEAGMEAILVSGKLEGEVPHAWNKVKIDGNWCIIDTTNNDSEFMSNALFNIPPEISSKILVEDNDYLLDSCLKKYEAQSEEYEYYHLTDNFFSVDSVVNELANKLTGTEKKMVVLRTDYQISDADFELICAQLRIKMGKNTNLMGSHWLGVICIIRGDME